MVCKVVEGVGRERSDAPTLVLTLWRELEGGSCGRLLSVKELGRAGGSLRTGPSHNEAHKQRYREMGLAEPGVKLMTELQCEKAVRSTGARRSDAGKDKAQLEVGKEHQIFCDSSSGFCPALVRADVVLLTHLDMDHVGRWIIYLCTGVHNT